MPKRTNKKKNISLKKNYWGNNRKLLNIKVTRNAFEDGSEESNSIQEPRDLMKYVKQDEVDKK